MGKRGKKSYFVRSALTEIELLRKHFDIRGTGDKVRLSGEVFPSSIQDFYREYFAKVRPANLGDDKILPRPDESKLRAWYVGHPDINILLNSVVRHCLYVDQIVLVDPFIILPHGDVLKRPQVWAEIMINRALCLCALEDWIAHDIVLIIPSLFHYHAELWELIASNPSAFLPRFTEEYEQAQERYFIIRLLVQELPEARGAALDLLESMGRHFAKGERESLLSEVEQYEARYPIRFRLSAEYYEKHFKGSETSGQVLSFSLGVPLMLAPVLAEQIGAFLVFENRFVYDSLSISQEPMTARTGSLQQLAMAFQGLDFPFLHNVSLKKALELREKGYLQSFRVYLRDLWATVAEVEEDELLGVRILQFTDRLTSEYVKLEQEWRNIRKELRIKAVTSGVAVGLSAGSAIAVGTVDWTVPAIAGAGVGLLKEQLSGYLGSSEKVQAVYKNPLSVFLMLD